MLRKIFILLIVVGAVVAYFFYGKYKDVTTPNVPEKLKKELLLIPTNSTFEEVVSILLKNNQIIDTASFKTVAEMMNYKKPVMRAGRYKIQPNWNNRELIGHLRGGKQEPVNLVLNISHLPEFTAGKVAKFIEADSVDLVNLFYDKNYIAQFGYTEETLISLFIPNTYQFYWNSSAKDFFERMVKEHNTFWKKTTEDGGKTRLDKAADRNMSAQEIYTLASILEKETNRNEEKKRMAGVYLNRLEQGIPLQADPTLKFAMRDFGARRVLKKHIEFDSPYNTYKNAGLPPGPISMASIASIDAVLNAETHSYLYFCARPDNSGYHAFAKTLAGHNKNARRYHRWLNSRGIRR